MEGPSEEDREQWRGSQLPKLAHETMTALARARLLNQSPPTRSRELSLAVTALEEALLRIRQATGEISL